MRCKFCGSTSLHPDTQHKTFSTGKAVAGAVMFGAVGAAAGLIGKDQNGYRCGACGAFMDAPMDSFTEIQVNGAIRDAESGKSRALYDYYKAQYPNIQASIPQQIPEAAPAPAALPAAAPALLPAAADRSSVKRSYRCRLWLPDCPIFVESVILHAGEREDRLSLIAWNQSGKTIRSAYFRARVLDDTGDEVSQVRCVYQNLSTPGGAKSGDEAMLPADKTFPLGTDLAYQVELTCEKVAFEGDEVWRLSEDEKEITLPDQPLLTGENFPRIKYVQTKYAATQKFRATREKVTYDPRFIMPAKGDGFWLCDCGHPVKEGARCRYCHDDWANVEKAFSQSRLRELQQSEVKSRAAARAAKTWPLYEAAAAEAARKEEAANSAKYAEARRNQDEDTIDSLRKALNGFRSLNDYRDSVERAAACADRIPVLEEEKREKEEAERLEQERQAEEKRIAEEKAAKQRKRTIAIVTPVIIACIAFVIVLTTVIIPKQKYNAAVAKYGQEYVDAFYSLKVGNTFIFGSYEQDNNTANGKEDIEWLVLAKKDSRILVISKYALDCQKNPSRASVTWETCSLRKWLNGTFLNAAFSEEERAMIPSVSVSADKNPSYSTSPGNSTTDQVFLLSIKEANKYFSSDEARKCAPTDYAVAQGARTSDSSKVYGRAACWWWLRSPGSYSNHAARVYSGGSVDDYGISVSDDGYAVRPALWINLGS